MKTTLEESEPSMRQRDIASNKLKDNSFNVEEDIVFLELNALRTLIFDPAVTDLKKKQKENVTLF